MGIEVDRKRVENAFREYAGHYDLTDVKIKLKADHTYRVAAMCDAISDSLHLDMEEKNTAWLCGMLHDIGRFEQLRRYHTFQDRISCNHAALSADILFHDGLIRNFVPASEKDAVIEKAIRLHNILSLPGNLTDEEYRFATILRDADKIDILRVNCETPRTEIYDLPEEAFRTSSVSQHVYEDAMNGRNVDRKYSKTGIDFLIGHICFVFGLIYPESFRQVRKQGFLSQLMSYQSDNPDTARKMTEIRNKVEAYIDEKAAAAP